MPISSSSSGGINTCDCKTVTFTHPLTQSWIILPTTLLQHLLSCEHHDATLHTKAKHNNQAENRITELKHAFHHHTQKHMLFCEHNVTEWRDQKITSRPIPRLFFETKIFETETDTLKKLRKVSIPRSLETRCHTLIDHIRKYLPGKF